MLELFRRFLSDPDFATARIRALLFGVGTLFSQGIITLDVLSDKLGPAGWWIGVALTLVAVSLRAGDVTPPAAKALGDGDPAKVNQLLANVGAPQVAPPKA